PGPSRAPRAASTAGTARPRDLGIDPHPRCPGDRRAERERLGADRAAGAARSIAAGASQRRSATPTGGHACPDALMHSGGPWRDVPPAYGPWQTIYTRYALWVRTGLWDRIAAILHPDLLERPPAAPP